MQVEFKNKYLLELYTKGKSRKYILEKNFLKKFFLAIALLESAEDIYYLRKIPSFKFEKLKGYKNRFSMRLSRKMRLEFEIEWEDVQKTTGIFYIKELSPHYRD